MNGRTSSILLIAQAISEICLRRRNEKCISRYEVNGGYSSSKIQDHSFNIIPWYSYVNCFYHEKRCFCNNETRNLGITSEKPITVSNLSYKRTTLPSHVLVYSICTVNEQVCSFLPLTPLVGIHERPAWPRKPSVNVPDNHLLQLNLLIFRLPLLPLLFLLAPYKIASATSPPVPGFAHNLRLSRPLCFGWNRGIGSCNEAACFVEVLGREPVPGTAAAHVCVVLVLVLGFGLRRLGWLGRVLRFLATC
jgi:hypothetical protein